MTKHMPKLFVLLPLLILLMGARTAPIVDPVSLDVQAGLTQKQVGEAVRQALMERRWLIDTNNPGSIDSTLHVRKHTVKIHVDFSATKVTFHYVSSENLNYSEEEGERIIHKSYNSWIDNLVNSTRLQLQRVVYGN